jgi:hypothetical protein
MTFRLLAKQFGFRIERVHPQHARDKVVKAIRGVWIAGLHLDADACARNEVAVFPVDGIRQHACPKLNLRHSSTIATTLLVFKLKPGLRKKLSYIGMFVLCSILRRIGYGVL